MQTKSFYSPRDRRFRCISDFNEIELRLQDDRDVIIREVQKQIAARLTDRVMKVLEPAIDKAIKELVL